MTYAKSCLGIPRSSVGNSGNPGLTRRSHRKLDNLTATNNITIEYHLQQKQDHEKNYNQSEIQKSP